MGVKERLDELKPDERIVTIRGFQSWRISPRLGRIIDELRKRGIFPHYYYHPDDPIKPKDGKFPSDEVTLKLKLPIERPRGIRGWCTWPSVGQNVNRQYILEMLPYLVSLAIECLQIDDGWTKKRKPNTNKSVLEKEDQGAIWGDWLSVDTEKFPYGMATMAQEIKEAGIEKQGLWIAPFLADSDSEIFQQHPDWFIKNPDGTYYNAIKTKTSKLQKYTLDITNEAVINHLKNVITTIVDVWGFNMLKLDFLYAFHSSKATSNEVADQKLQEFIGWIRTTFPNIYILASGCPLVPILNCEPEKRPHAVRVSDDNIDLTLVEDVDSGKVRRYILRCAIALRLLQLRYNLADRAELSEFAALDPDIFCAHPKFGITKREMRRTRDIGIATDGVRMIGDDLRHLEQKYIDEYIIPFLNHKPSSLNRSLIHILNGTRKSQVADTVSTLTSLLALLAELPKHTNPSTN